MIWNKPFGKSKSQQDAPSSEGERLNGRWILKHVGGKQPPITMHLLHFNADGTWESQSILLNAGGGNFEMAGGGVWEISDGILSFTAGENSGRTEITVEENVVTLGKDPMLQLTEYPDKTCVYARTSESEAVEFAAYLRDVGEKMSQSSSGRRGAEVEEGDDSIFVAGWNNLPESERQYYLDGYNDCFSFRHAPFGYRPPAGHEQAYKEGWEARRKEEDEQLLREWTGLP